MPVFLPINTNQTKVIYTGHTRTENKPDDAGAAADEPAKPADSEAK